MNTLLDLFHHPFAFYPSSSFSPGDISASVDLCTSPPRLVGFLHALFHTLVRFTRLVEEVHQNFETFLKGKHVLSLLRLHRHVFLNLASKCT